MKTKDERDLETQATDPGTEAVEHALRRKAAQVNPDPGFVSRCANLLRRQHTAAAPVQRRRVPTWAWLSSGVAAMIVVALVARALLPGGGTPTIQQTEIALAPTLTSEPQPAEPSATGTTAPTQETEPIYAKQLPPAIATVSPAPGAEVSTKAGITLKFSQPMDRASVENALYVTPKVDGTFTWVDDQTVTFAPKALAAATRYAVRVGTDALAANGLTLTQELAYTFSTMYPLTVTHATPADGTMDLRGDAPILISFNYPIVPINCTGQAAGQVEGCPDLPLAISPAVVGQGMWINTSVYRFDPLPGWAAGASYSVELPAGTTSLGGAVLEGLISWSFRTTEPRITSVEPENGGTNMPLESAVILLFNTPMDREATAAAFTLTDNSGSTIPGTFTWADGASRVVFTPTQLLSLDTAYRIRVTADARSINGTPIIAPRESGFRTSPAPAVVRIQGVDKTTPMNKLKPWESVKVEFQGLIDGATLADNLKLTADGEEIEPEYWWDDYERVLYIHELSKPDVQYCVRVLSDVADHYGNKLGQEVSACFIGADQQPIFVPTQQANALALDAAEAARIYFVSVNVPAAEFTLSTMRVEDFGTYQASGRQQLRQWTESTGIARNDTGLVAVDLAEDGGPLPTGVYQLRWSASELQEWTQRQVYVAVIGTHLTLKMSADEALVWVTDLRSGQPVAGRSVRLLNSVGRQIATGSSDADGVARIRIPRQADLWETFTAVLETPGSPEFGIVRSDWNEDVSPWSFAIQADYGPTQAYQVYLQTDRPIYRPAQTIYYKGIVRVDNDVRYTLPAVGQVVQLTLRDSNWETVTSTTVLLNESGSFSGEFTLSEEARLGGYSLEANLVEYTQRNWSLPLTVAAYRKPEFEVSVLPEATDLLDGQDARYLIEARYYSGGLVSNAKIHWVLRARPFSFLPDVAGWWTWQANGWIWDWWVESEVLAEGDAMTDSAGQALVTIPTELKPLLPNSDEIGPQTWELQATVTDEAGFPVTQEGMLTVHTGGFYIGLRPRSWIAQAGQVALVDVMVLDWAEQPVANQTVEIALVSRAWKMIPSTKPFQAGTWEHTDTVIQTLSVTTDAQGKAEAAVTPPSSGSYVVTAQARDRNERLIRSETYIWVGGPQAAFWQQAENQTKPVADAQSYKPGDTARILVPTSFTAPFEVLMTVERGSILEVRRFTAQDSSPVVELPIVDDHVPNIIVSFIVVKGVDGANPVPDVRVGMIELEVEPVRQTLTVEVTADSGTYGPGERAYLTIWTRDAAGQPVSAEVALAVIDKAVLALADPNALSIVESFYSPRPLSVFTGDSLVALYNRSSRNLEQLALLAERVAAEAAIGGIGGGGGDGMAFIADVREDFPDTTLWEAYLRTDANGQAEVVVDLPDSLTTWVIDARAATEDTKVGQTTAEIVVSKPLYVQPVTPRFLVAGDRSHVAAVVHNNTESDFDVNVSLVAKGVTLDEQDPAGGPASQLVRVPARGRTRVAWTVIVDGAGSDAAVLTFIAEGGGYSDATRPTLGQEPDQALPIYRYETPDVFGTFGALSQTDTRLEAIVIPANAGPDSTLTVRIEPSLAAGMTEGLSYLEHFEYECTEQLVSRFLPNVVTYRALQSLGISDPELEEHLRALVTEAVGKLRDRQAQDGGWGWWTDNSDFQTSAYAVLGLIQAQRAGYEVDQQVLDRAVSYLERTLSTGLRGDARTLPQAFALYVLAEARGSWPEGTDAALFEEREKLDPTGRAYLTLALGIADPGDPRVEVLLESLRADAAITATGAHWEGEAARFWMTWTRATSVVLDSFARFAADDPLVPQAVRWLMAARIADRWETTQETAWAVMALTQVMLSTGELQSSYAWQLNLNSGILGQGAVTPETLRTPTTFTVPASSLLREWPNALEVFRSAGVGTLYYAAHLTLYHPVEVVEAESRGITVLRQYCAVKAAPEPLAWDDDFGPCTSISSAKPGDLVEVRLTIVLPQTRSYLMLEDPYPAGMEPVDPTLNTEIQEGVAPETDRVSRTDLWWWPSFSHQELRDERAVFFARTLAAGTYQVRYYLRATIPGEYRVIPAVAREMYFPEVWGRTEGSIFQVEP